MKKFATASVILLLISALAIPVFGHGFGQGRGPGMMRGGSGGYCSDGNTNLTAEQSKEIKALRDKHLEEITPLRNDLFAKRSELRLLWNKETPDRDQIKAKESEIDAIQDQLRDKMIDYRLDADKIAPSNERGGFCGNYDRRGFKGGNDRHGFMGFNDRRGREGMGGMRW